MFHVLQRVWLTSLDIKLVKDIKIFYNLLYPCYFLCYLPFFDVKRKRPKENSDHATSCTAILSVVSRESRPFHRFLCCTSCWDNTVMWTPRIWQPSDCLDTDLYEIEKRNRNLSVTERWMSRISLSMNYCVYAQVTKCKSPRDAGSTKIDITFIAEIHCTVAA